MPKAKKSQSNMDSLVDVIEGRAGLLSLLERRGSGTVKFLQRKQRESLFLRKLSDIYEH
jgi:hypothetical protein